MFPFFLSVFLLTFTLCISSYALYPVIIWVFGKLFPFKVHIAEIIPFISIIIPANNEAKHIEKKMLNTLALDYPGDKFEILIGSDGSTDGTADIVRKHMGQGIQLHEFKTNRGKTAVQNDLVRQSQGEIIVFTDAASFLPKDALQKIVRNFADDRVGCVGGRMQFVDTETNLTTESQGIYWRYEVKIRELESSIGHLIGVDGPLYAVRRQNYISLECNMISDLITPLLVLEQGKKVILEPDAVVKEEPTEHTDHEFNTRRRITLRGLTGIFCHGRLLNPFKHPALAFQIFFHKVLRWFVGPLVAINFISCLALFGSWFFKFFLLLYAFFIVAGFLGWFLEKHGIKVRALTVPYYFSLVNFAATMGIVDFLKKKQAVSWKPVRH